MGAIRPGGGGGGGASALGDLTDIGTMGEPIAQADNLTEVVTAMGGASSVRAAIDAAEDGAPPSVTAADITDSTATGQALMTAANAAAARTLLLGTFSDALSGSGWSSASATGGAAASWASGPARLVLNCAPGSAGSCGVESTTRLPSTDTYDVAIRVRFDVGDGSANGRVLFVVGRDSANRLVLTLSAAGALQAGRTVGGSYTGYTVLYDAGIDSNARTGGQLWVRASRSPQGFVWLWGIGAGGQLPTAWVEYWASAQLAASSGYSYTVVANGLSQGPFVGIYLVTVSAIDVDASVLDLVTGLPGAFGGA